MTSALSKIRRWKQHCFQLFLIRSMSCFVKSRRGRKYLNQHITLEVLVLMSVSRAEIRMIFILQAFAVDSCFSFTRNQRDSWNGYSRCAGRTMLLILKVSSVIITLIIMSSLVGCSHGDDFVHWQPKSL